MVDEKYTKPQGLYLHKDVDHKKLRKLILDSKLAPCYPGDDDTAFDLEECPICFLVCLSFIYLLTPVIHFVVTVMNQITFQEYLFVFCFIVDLFSVLSQS